MGSKTPFCFSLFLSPTVLCSERVGQVTKTYHDIKAVTHLLEEVRGRHPADQRKLRRACVVIFPNLTECFAAWSHHGRKSGTWSWRPGSASRC